MFTKLDKTSMFARLFDFQALPVRGSVVREPSGLESVLSVRARTASCRGFSLFRCSHSPTLFVRAPLDRTPLDRVPFDRVPFDLERVLFGSVLLECIHPSNSALHFEEDASTQQVSSKLSISGDARLDDPVRFRSITACSFSSGSLTRRSSRGFTGSIGWKFHRLAMGPGCFRTRFSTVAPSGADPSLSLRRGFGSGRMRWAGGARFAASMLCRTKSTLW